jgi:hypothetical protein
MLNLLVLYRSLFHPILFFLPITGVLLILYKDKCRTILLFSVISFLIAFSPYLKNDIIFGTWDVAGGSFGLAMRASTYEYRAKEQLLADVDQGLLSPLVLCYKQILEPLTYHGELYSPENCYQTIIPRFGREKAALLLARNSKLAYPAILQEKNNRGFSDNYIPNDLLGLAVAMQMRQDAKSYLIHHPWQYLHSVENNFTQLFRTNVSYEFMIANNSRHYPVWFSSRLFSLDFLAYNQPVSKLGGTYDMTYRPQILIGMLAALVFAVFFAWRPQKSVAISLLHVFGLLAILSPIFIKKIFNHLHIPFETYMDYCLFWTLGFLLVGFILTLKNWLTTPIQLDQLSVKQGIFSLFAAFCCIYFIMLVDMIPGSEQDRYRFVIEGLLITLFLFWLTKLVQYIRHNLSNMKQIK